MDESFEALTRQVPFASWIQEFGLSWQLSILIIVLINIGLVFILVYLVKRIAKHHRLRRAEKQLGTAFGYQMLKDARKNFIETRFQNHNPAREEELLLESSQVARIPLIPHLIKTAFNEERKRQKFYIVLGGSGMGKTTFMINLYMRYHSFWNFRKRYKMRLFSFREDDLMEKIGEISRDEARNTILLLDAFDEDRHILRTQVTRDLSDDRRFNKRLNEIIESVKDFREVIITSRTQYFPGEEEQPYELSIRRLDERGYHQLGKIYLSPFSDVDVKKYLNQKFGWCPSVKKNKAKKVIEQSPKLMVRPMLLGYIDLLINSEKKFISTYEIYSELIDKWIEREATKFKKESEKEQFSKALLYFSMKIADLIDQRRAETNSFSVSKEEAIQVSEENYLDLENLEITGKSLLNRDANHNWKFAHKSILEFFVARKKIREYGFWKI